MTTIQTLTPNLIAVEVPEEAFNQEVIKTKDKTMLYFDLPWKEYPHDSITLDDTYNYEFVTEVQSLYDNKEYVILKRTPIK